MIMVAPFTATFIVLTILGMADTAYLVYTHHKKRPLMCPLDHDCGVVTESKWSKTLGIRNEALGFLFYGVLLGGILLSIIQLDIAQRIQFFLGIATGMGFFYSLFLLYLQRFVIRDWCFYCIISAVLSFLLFLNGIALS